MCCHEAAAGALLLPAGLHTGLQFAQHRVCSAIAAWGVISRCQPLPAARCPPSLNTVGSAAPAAAGVEQCKRLTGGRCSWKASKIRWCAC